MKTAAAPTGDSPTAVASNLPFKASPVDPPKMEAAASKSSKMTFLRRSKAKSRDDDEAAEEEALDAELRKLEKKVEYLEKKNALLSTIKRMERDSSESDDETDKRSPKRWSSFKVRRWKRGDSFDDDLTFDDDESPLLQRFHSTLDCIEDGCAPIINEIKDIPALCGELISPLETPERHKRIRFGRKSKSARADEKTVASDAPDDLQASLALTEPIANLARQISQSFSFQEDAAEDPKTKEKSDSNNTRSKGRSAAMKEKAASDSKKDKTNGPKVPHNDEQAFGWLEQATSMFRSQSQPQKDDASIGLDCFEMLGGKPKDEKPGATDTSNELDAKFVKVTVGARVLSGLSITSKKNEDKLPPVRVVLSVLKNTIFDESSSSEGASFTHLSSLRVVKDPSRESSKKDKCHVMGVWDLGKEDEASVTFSRLTGLSTFGDGAKEYKNMVTKQSPSMVHLRVCIKREGSNDLLPIGVAKVLVSGEARDAELAIPIKTEYYRSLGELTKKLNSKPPQSKWESLKTFILEEEDEPLTFVRFKGFKNETYRLEKDSFIRIKLLVTPDIPKKEPDQQDHPSSWIPSSLLTPESLPVSKATQTASLALEKPPIASHVDESKDTKRADPLCNTTPETCDVEGQKYTPSIDMEMILPEESTPHKSQKSKKSLLTKSKKTKNKIDKANPSTAQPVLDDTLDVKDDRNNAEDNYSAGLIGAGVAAGIGTLKLAAMETSEDNGKQNHAGPTGSDLVSSDPSNSAGQNISNHTEGVVDTDDMRPVEVGSTKKTATGKSKKSWFKKTKKSEADNTKTTPMSSETVLEDTGGIEARGVALVGTGTAAAKALGATDRKKGDVKESDEPSYSQRAVSSNSAAVDEDNNTHDSEGINKMASDEEIAENNPIQSVEEDLVKKATTSQSKKSWFNKKTGKAAVGTNEATPQSSEQVLDDTEEAENINSCGDVGSQDVAFMVGCAVTAAAVTLEGKELLGNETGESSKVEENTDATVDPLEGSDNPTNLVSTEATHKSKKSWLKMAKKTEVETTKAIPLSSEPTLDATKVLKIHVDKGDVALAGAGEVRAAAVPLGSKELFRNETDENPLVDENTDATVDPLDVANMSENSPDLTSAGRLGNPRHSKVWFKKTPKARKIKPRKASSPRCVSEFNETPLDSLGSYREASKSLPPLAPSLVDKDGISDPSYSDRTDDAEPKADGKVVEDSSLIGNDDHATTLVGAEAGAAVGVQLVASGSDVDVHRNDSGESSPEEPVAAAEVQSDINQKSRKLWYKKLKSRKSKGAQALSESDVGRQPFLNEQATLDDGEACDIDPLSLAETLAVLHQNDFGCQPDAEFEVKPGAYFGIESKQVYELAAHVVRTASESSVVAGDNPSQTVSMGDVVAVTRSTSNISFGIGVVSSIDETDHCDLSECHCEDCMKHMEGEAKEDEEDECLGIELELKQEPPTKKCSKGHEDVLEQKPEQKQSPLRRNHKKVSGLAGKLSRAWDSKSKAPDTVFYAEV